MMLPQGYRILADALRNARETMTSPERLPADTSKQNEVIRQRLIAHRVVVLEIAKCARADDPYFQGGQFLRKAGVNP